MEKALLNVRVISFATEGEYEEEAKPLVSSCEKFNVKLNLVIYKRDFLKSWQEAVMFKPEFIYEQLKLWDSDDGVLWVDADAEFVSKPDFSVFNYCDLSWHKLKRTPEHTPENLSGTMFFRNGYPIQSFVYYWASITPQWAGRDTPEQDSLRGALNGGKTEKLLYRDCGPEWVYIYDDFKEIYPNVSPIIMHRQASRRLKNALKK